LIATILSAQTTDRSVNLVTPELFRRYPTADDLAAADPAEVEKLIKPTGFFRLKTRRIIAGSRAIAELFGGAIRAFLAYAPEISGAVFGGIRRLLEEQFARLSPLEQSLLYLLAANAGRVVTREEILDTLWGADYVAESNVVDRQIRNLRARLQDDWRQPRFIATVPGRGYRFLPTFTDSGAAIRTP